MYYNKQEDFYYHFMLQLLQIDDHKIRSKQVNCNEFVIILLPNQKDVVVILECKHSASRTTLKKILKKLPNKLLKKSIITLFMMKDLITSLVMIYPSLKNRVILQNRRNKIVQTALFLYLKRLSTRQPIVIIF